VFKSPWITLFNIAAKAFVAPEFVQDRCTGERLAAAVAERLDDPALRARQTQAQNEALAKMGRGGPDPSEAAADTILKLLAERSATTVQES
jgi:lipid-A-disaccharide synthase